MIKGISAFNVPFGKTAGFKPAGKALSFESNSTLTKSPEVDTFENSKVKKAKQNPLSKLVNWVRRLIIIYIPRGGDRSKYPLMSNYLVYETDNPALIGKTSTINLE